MRSNRRIFSRFLLLIFASSILQARFSLAKDEASTCIDCTLPEVASPVGEHNLSGLKTLAETLNQGSLKDATFLDPQLVENTDSRLLGQMIVNRLTELCDKLRDPGLTKPDDNFSEIIMLIPMKHIESIAKYGFKNQHQTSVTGGCDCKSNRLMTEEAHVMLGLPYTNKTRELLPKYALQVFNTTEMGQHPLPLQYGDVLVRFKPSVKKRATWSQVDSLGISTGFNENLLPLRTNAIRQPKGTKTDGSYFEAQIWGNLDFTDVESIAIPEGTELPDAVKALGVPVHNYKYTPPAYGFSWGASKGGMVGSPASTSAPAPEAKPVDPSRSSVKGLEFVEKPILTPASSAQHPSVSSMKLDEVKKAMTSSTNPVQRNILDGVRLSKMKTEDLIAEYNDPRVSTEQKESPSGSWAADGNVLGSAKARVLAEIAAREKTKETTALLIKEFKENSDVTIKAMALTGLGRLDPKELKPLLIEALKSDSALLTRTAGFMSLPFKDEPAFNGLLNGNFKEISKRFNGKEFCAKEVYGD